MTTVIKGNFKDGNKVNEYAYMRAKILGGGRMPIAYAEIIGGENESDIQGSVSFYYTPIGVLVCASMSGLKEGISYNLTLRSESGEVLELPTVYARNGVGWCADITAKLTPWYLDGGCVALSRSGFEAVPIAVGHII